MPVQKGVLPLGSLCIEKITQMLIEIICISQPKSNKLSHLSKAPEDQQQSSHKETHELGGAKVGEDHDQQHMEQEEDHNHVNGAQNSHDYVVDAEDVHRASEEEDVHDQDDSALDISHQVSCVRGTHGQANGAQDTHSSKDVHDQVTGAAEDDPCHVSELTSNSTHEAHDLSESEAHTSEVEEAKEVSPESNNQKLGKKDVVPEKPEKETQKENKFETVRRELCRLLTSHSHVTLHRHLFDSVTTRLDPIYMRDKRVRPAVQDIVTHFINSTLRDLDFGRVRMFSEIEMCKVLYEHLHKTPRLEKLVIGRSCYWRSQIFEKLSTKLVSMQHLTVLKIQYIGTPEMIQGLSEICPKLYELSLAGSEKITDQQCGEIAKCDGLTTLNISGTRITGRGCWKILEAIKSLSWLHHCAFNCNSDSLLFESRADLYNCIKEQLRRGENAISLVDRPDLSLRDVRFNLKNFWLFNPFTEDLLTSVLCPSLESLRLDFVFQDLEEEPDVTILSSLTQIKKLEVNLYDRCSIDLVGRMVEGCGERLTTLELHLADDWFFVAQAHNIVATCCPNLVTLTFSGDYKARHTLEECDERLDFGIPAPAHPHLKHLKLIGVVSDQRLHFVLNHTPALHTLRMDGELEWLHDATFATVLETNPLPNLEELWFNVSTTVTLATVRRLLQQDNPLRCIGRLCHMAKATMSEYQELLSQVRQRNLDVKLIWVTDERIK